MPLTTTSKISSTYILGKKTEHWLFKDFAEVSKPMKYDHQKYFYKEESFWSLCLLKVDFCFFIWFAKRSLSEIFGYSATVPICVSVLLINDACYIMVKQLKLNFQKALIRLMNILYMFHWSRVSTLVEVSNLSKLFEIIIVCVTYLAIFVS